MFKNWSNKSKYTFIFGTIPLLITLIYYLSTYIFPGLNIPILIAQLLYFIIRLSFYGTILGYIYGSIKDSKLPPEFLDKQNNFVKIFPKIQLWIMIGIVIIIILMYLYTNILYSIYN